MSCKNVLDQLIQQFKNCPGGHDNWCEGYTRWLEHLLEGEVRRRRLLIAYPLCCKQKAIAALTSKQVYSKGDDKCFFRWIGWSLEWLGALGGGPGLPLAFRNAAGPYLKQFKELLTIALDDSKTLAEKIDAPWENIPGFGGDKQIAKKIVATYYRDDTLPIFVTERMECHAKRLGIDIDLECTRKYGLHYAAVNMTVGKKWELLTEVLLERKAHHPPTAARDNVYFMYVLEHSKCPPHVAR